MDIDAFAAIAHAIQHAKQLLANPDERVAYYRNLPHGGFGIPYAVPGQPYASVWDEAYDSLKLALMSLQTKGELQEVLNYRFPPDFKDTPNNYDLSKMSKEEIAHFVTRELLKKRDEAEADNSGEEEEEGGGRFRFGCRRGGGGGRCGRVKHDVCESLRCLHGRHPKPAGPALQPSVAVRRMRSQYPAAAAVSLPSLPRGYRQRGACLPLGCWKCQNWAAPGRQRVSPTCV